MRQSIPFLFAASLLASGYASAAPSHNASKVRPTHEQMEQLQGAYRLTDGGRVQVLVVDGRLYADIGKHERQELFAVGADAVTSRDGRVTLRTAGAEASLALRSKDSAHLLTSL